MKWLNALAFKMPAIIWLEGNSHYRFDQVLFSNAVVADQQPSVWSAASIKVNYNHLSKFTDKKTIIWASRSGLDQRAFKWEKLMADQFPFVKIVDFTLLSTEETTEICGECDVFIGPHGAGFSNIVFCKQTAVVVELFPDLELLPLYGRLSHSLGLKHFVINLNFENSEAANGLNLLTEVFAKLKINRSE